MSATAVCGWGAAAGAATAASPSCSRSDPPAAAGSRCRAAGQSLIPVVGLVNRTKDRLQTRNLRLWQQSSRSANGKQRWRAPIAKKLAVSVSEGQFEAEVLNSPVPVLVDFWATWCGPCRIMGITLDWAAQQYEGKIKCVKIETDSNQGLVDKYKVYGLPTLILFVDGKVLPNTQREGALTKEKLRAYLETNVPTLVPTV